MARGPAQEVLTRLPWLLEERLQEAERAQQLVRDAVRDLVLAGYSWADVGRMLGVTRQAARQRYGAEVDLWREHMGDRMPWDDWGDEFLSAAEELEREAAYGRVLDAAPIEDER